MSKELLERLKNTEDNFTERKLHGVKNDEIRKTIVAFANSVPEGRTAVFYIGVRNDGSIQGVPNPDSLQKTIRKICEKGCYPPIVPRCEVLTIKDQSILSVVISQSNNRPHFSGPAYVRIGSESVAASDEIFHELITSRLAKPYEILRWKGKQVTVVARDKILGDPEYLPHYVRDLDYYDAHECEIIGCTPHFVRLRDLATDRYLSEPLENVTLATDEKNKVGLC